MLHTTPNPHLSIEGIIKINKNFTNNVSDINFICTFTYVCSLYVTKQVTRDITGSLINSTTYIVA